MTGSHEFDPALARVERQHAAGALAVGEVQVLRVRAEGVRAVAAARHRDLLARLHEHDGVAHVPCIRGRRAAPLELLRDVCHRARVRAPNGGS